LQERQTHNTTKARQVLALVRFEVTRNTKK
jgi:hypothetical protein